MPDPALEGVFGVGEVPPHRGTAYIVMDNELLDDTGGAVPQWIFEVERSEGVFLTSTLYPIESIESIYPSINQIKQSPEYATIESILPQVSVTSGELKTPLIEYTNLPAESLSASQVSVTSGELKTPLIKYTNWPAESLSASQVSVTSGELKTLLIKYTNWPAESLSASQVSVTSGVLS